MEQEDQDKVLNTRWNKKIKIGTKYTMEQEDQDKVLNTRWNKKIKIRY